MTSPSPGLRRYPSGVSVNTRKSLRERSFGSSGSNPAGRAPPALYAPVMSSRPSERALRSLLIASPFE